MASRQQFEAATSVAAWLEGNAGLGVRRVQSPRQAETFAWDINLEGEFPGVGSVRLVLPAAFPAEPCWFEVAPDLELQFPHVERGGKLCLQTAAYPADYDDPIGAVIRALTQLRQDFLLKLTDQNWVAAEFQRECLTYWGLYCTDRRRPTKVERKVGLVYLDTTGLDTWANGSVVGYLKPGTKHGHFLRQVVTCNDVSPHDTAQRLQWSYGTAVHGHALVIRLPASHPWTPKTWPRTSAELDQLIQKATNSEASLAQLIADARPRFEKQAKVPKYRTTHVGKQIPIPHSPPQLFVLLVLDGGAFGFWVRPLVRLSTLGVAIEPFEVDRIDADWTLARDHGLTQLGQRRAKRVLMLGAGSLGSPVAHMLTRAGIGHLTILDKESMEPENTSRHILGLTHAGLAKAPQLAEELMRLVPNVKVTGIQCDVTSWLPKNVRRDDFDLVIDCTAESFVRTFISNYRSEIFGDAPVIHAWLEPLCSAGHVVLTQAQTPWPSNDPADSLVNASDISADDLLIRNRACSGGFHPYGVADVTQVAAFAVERILAVLDSPDLPSTIWSWVRSKAFFDSLGMNVETRAIVPTTGGTFDTATATRLLDEVLSGE